MTPATAAPPDPALERVHALARALAEREAWTPERVRAHQRTALRSALVHAVERPLSELPTLPKGVLVEQWDRIVTDPALRLADAEAHAAGPAALEPFHGRYRVFSTSGSCGLRGLFVFAPDEWETWVALHLRMFLRIGLRPTCGSRRSARPVPPTSPAGCSRCCGPGARGRRACRF